LFPRLKCLISVQTRTIKNNKKYKIKRGNKMRFTESDHNYIESDEERDAGHEDTRYKNFECDIKTRLGCNMGIDVAG
jgi:hypothetical protein